MTEYLSTREIADRTGYSIDYVRKLLKSLSVPAMKRTKRSHARWHWPTVCEVFHVPQTVKSSTARQS